MEAVTHDFLECLAAEREAVMSMSATILPPKGCGDCLGHLEKCAVI